MPSNLAESMRKRSGIDAKPIVEQVRKRNLSAAQKQRAGAREESADARDAAILERVPRRTSGRRSTTSRLAVGENVDGIGERGWTTLGRISRSPQSKKLLEQRLEMAQGKRRSDYGMAEALAFGSLLEQGTPVRLSGQDSRRGRSTSGMRR